MNFNFECKWNTLSTQDSALSCQKIHKTDNLILKWDATSSFQKLCFLCSSFTNFSAFSLFSLNATNLERFQLAISKREMYPEKDGAVDRLVQDMTGLPIQHVGEFRSLMILIFASSVGIKVVSRISLWVLIDWTHKSEFQVLSEQEMSKIAHLENIDRNC